MASEAAVSAGPAALSARRGEAFYRALVEGMNDGVLTRDAAGVITYASPRFRDMLGYAAEELVGGKSEFVLPPEQRSRWERGLAAAAQGPQRFEHDLVCKDGRRVSVAVSRRPVFDAEGVFQGSVALVSNITEERRASRLLQEVAEATAPHVGEEFFRAAVRFLAQALRCKIVFITECVDFPTTRVRRVARWALDRLADNVEYDLADTACEETIKAGKVFYCASGVESRFAAARGLGVDSYLGLPLFGTEDDVIAFPTPQAFLAAYQRDHLPGCLLLDLRMPGMSGIDLFAELKRRGSRMPAIIMTGHGDVSVAVRAMKAGVYDFIEKPFKDQALLDLIQQALAQCSQAAGQAAQRGEIAACARTLTRRERQVMGTGRGAFALTH